MTLEEYAKVKIGQEISQDIKGLDWEQRIKYLLSISALIDEMLKEEPDKIGLLDNPMAEEQYFKQYPYDEGFFRT